ncbi:MAG TPA: site-specific integrase [Chthoniobacterales bacterium]|jgi:integrase|nr:site-specific integrase [Chthoniobacterales bacterium]
MKRYDKLPRTFPHLVKSGAVSVKIYRCKNRGYNSFAVMYSLGGKRRQKNFAKFEDARSEAQEMATRIARGDADVLQLSSADRSGYLAAMDLLRPLGIPLHSAVEEYVAARAHLKGESLLTVAKSQENRRRQVTDKEVGEIVEELLAAKKRDGLSDRYLETLCSHLNRFAKAFKTNIGSVAAKFIEEWLAARKVGPRARNNLRMSIVTLFNFARSRGYLPKGQPTEAEEVPRAKDRGGKIGILTPKQLSDLLSSSGEESQLYFALGAFTGLRSAELLRLEWEDVNFGRGHIQVGKTKAKTATRRLVPIQPNLMRWLSPYRKRSGAIFRSDRSRANAAYHAIAEAKKILGDWPSNALRHSYATYRLAHCHDSARVALEMGNSAQMLFRNYRELADEQDATAWFAIEPRPTPGVISIVSEIHGRSR